MSSDLVHKIGITLLPKIGPVLARNLISYCGSPEAVFSSSKRQLTSIPGIGDILASHILRQKVLKAAEQEIAILEKNGIKPLFYLDPDYPGRLKNLYDSPILLYYKGNAELNARRIVAIVGTRDPSVQGVRICQEIVKGLEPYDVLVVSGMAYGIDIVAHRTCLTSGMGTIGVLGHGHGTIYPYSHRRSAEEVLQLGGLLTEYTFSSGPEKVHFPQRNRVIAGLCDALIVIETARKGGSMISAQIANDYNKDVFAVPGRVNDAKSEGCNLLIKSHRASLLEGAKDLAYVMGWEKVQNKSNSGVQQSLFEQLEEEEIDIINLLRQEESLPIDNLTSLAGLNPGKLSSILLNLEFKGLVKAMPGKRYMLV